MEQNAQRFITSRSSTETDEEGEAPIQQQQSPVATSTPMQPTQRHVTINMDSTSQQQVTTSQLTTTATNSNEQLQAILTRMTDSITNALRQAAQPQVALRHAATTIPIYQK